MLIQYMTFTLKQQGEVLKKFVHQSLNKPLQIGFQRFISQNSVKVDFGPTFRYPFLAKYDMHRGQRSKAFSFSLRFCLTLGENKRQEQECLKERVDLTILAFCSIQ